MMKSLAFLKRRWGLLALVLAANLIVSSIAITPWSEAVRSGSLAGLPDPDAALLAEGGLVFVEWLRLDAASLLGALRATLWLAGLGALVQLLPAALLLVGLSDTHRLSLRRHGRRAVAVLPPFLLLFGSTLVCQALLVCLWVVLWGVCMTAAEPGAYPWLTLGLAALALLSWGLPSMLQDLTRAVLVNHETRVLGALGRGVGLFLAHPGRMLAAYLVPAGLGWLVAAASLGLTAKLALVKPAELADAANFAVHQACVLLLVALRAYWLSRALELSNASQPAPGDTREGTGEPGGPSPDHGA